MNTMKNEKRIAPAHKLVFQLWALMMALVLLAAVFIWTAQVFLFDKSYVESSVVEIVNRIEPIRAELETKDLADDANLLPYLSMSVGGKMLLINDQHELTEAYSMGYPVALASDSALLSSWCNIQEGEYYHFVTDREYFHDVHYVSRDNAWLYVGVPAQYYGMNVYILMMHPFADIYSVLSVNRQQLAVLCILLTLAASALAAVLSKRFTKPIFQIKRAVDSLAAGDLDAVPDVRRKDELGQLSDSVSELGTALKRVDILRKEVIANVSHELRTPLAHIGGYAEMARDLHRHADEKRTEDLDFIMHETSRMTEMVNDIMDYSQLQAGYLSLKKDKYNLYEIVESEVAGCERIAGENHISLCLESVTEEIPVLLDALKISRVIRNLLYNAVNHTQDGKAITIRIAAAENGVRVSVINPGEEIPEEDRALIWERYQRSQHQGGRKQGTGIGLSIVATILKAHDMPYGVDCLDGLTVFWFECATL